MSATTLKLISLNIERGKHLDLVENFLSSRIPDLVCMQELMGEHVERFSEALGGAQYVFEPAGRMPEEAPAVTIGIGIFSRLPIQKSAALYYAGVPGDLRDSYLGNIASYNNHNRMVLSVEVEKSGRKYRVGTTHFRWTPDGSANNLQREDMQALLKVLAPMEEFVLCGDFNAPRGGEIFGMLASKYKDNIPPHYKTSLDISLHRAGKTKPEELADKMVDGLFSTPAYLVSDVELVPGVSDHCAVVSSVSTSKG